MKKLTRYILEQLSFAVLAVTLMLTSIIWFVFMLRYLERIASEGMSFEGFLFILLNFLPSVFVIICPIAFFISILFVYNKLLADHELMVMQAAGVSPWQLARPASVLIVVFTGILYFFTLHVVPFSTKYCREVLSSLDSHPLLGLVSVGQFNTFGQRTIYAHHQDSQGNFLGVLLYDNSQPDKTVILMAEKGILLNEPEGQKLLLVNGNRQETLNQTGKSGILYFSQYVLSAKEGLLNTPQKTSQRSTEERSLRELFTPQGQIPSSKRWKFFLVAHQRLVSPLIVSAFGFMGVSFMVLGHFNRRGRIGKIVGVSLLATLLQICIIACFQVNTYPVLMVTLAYFLAVVPGVVSFCFLTGSFHRWNLLGRWS